MDSNIMVLPCEVLMDILSRLLSVKHVHQLTTVSKLWYRTISSPQFRTIYNMKSVTRPRALLVQVPDSEYSSCGWNMISRNIEVSTVDLAGDSEIHKEFSFVDMIAHEHSFNISSNLIIFNNKVCNPSTREIADLPISSYPHFSFDVGYIPSTNTYKIVHLFGTRVGLSYNFDHGGKNEEFRFETLALRDGGPVPSSWQSLGHKECFVYKIDTTCVNDVIYWLVGRRDEIELHIISMQIESEEFLCNIRCPREANDYEESSLLGHRQQLADFNGKLCLSYYSDEWSRMDLFLLKNHEKQEWVKEYTIDLSGMGNWFELVGYLPLEDKNGDVILDGPPDLLYNIEEKRFTRLPRLKRNIYIGLYFDRCFKLESKRLNC